MDRSAAFLRVIGHLDDLHTLAYDRRGYARSIGTDPPAASIASGVDDLLGLLDGRPATVVGHSFGGHVALAAGIARPDVVRAVAVWEAPLAWLDWWPSDSAGSVAVAAPTPHAAAETFLRLLLGDDTWERLPPGTQAVRRLEGPALLGDLAAIRNKGQPPYDWAQFARAASGRSRQRVQTAPHPQRPAAGRRGPRRRPRRHRRRRPWGPRLPRTGVRRVRAAGLPARGSGRLS